MSNLYNDLTTIKGQLQIASTDTNDDAILLILLEAASRAIDNWVKRFFYVQEGTRYYDGADQMLFLDDVLTITTFKTDDDLDGTYENSWTADEDYQLYPLPGQINEYPKLRAEISTRETSEFTTFNNGAKKGVQIVGTFGFADSATPYKDSGAVLNTGGMTNSVLTHALASGKGALFSVGQTVRIGSEQLYISAISTDTLTFLANPTRNQNGTAAAAHLAGDTIYIYTYPEMIKLGTLIQAMRWFKRKDSAFQDVVGSAETGDLQYYKKLDPDVANVISMYLNMRAR
jgi:hypothetical protein